MAQRLGRHGLLRREKTEVIKCSSDMSNWGCSTAAKNPKNLYPSAFDAVLYPVKLSQIPHLKSPSSV